MKKSKMYFPFFIILAGILLLIFSLALPGYKKAAETELTIVLNSGAWELNYAENSVCITPEVPEAGPSPMPYAPVVPRRLVNVLLPPDTTYTGLQIVSKKVSRHTYKGKWLLGGKDGPLDGKVQKEKETESRLEGDPDQPVRMVGEKKYGPYRIVVLEHRPFKVFENGRFMVYDRLEVKIQCKKDTRKLRRPSLRNCKFEDHVINHEMIGEYKPLNIEDFLDWFLDASYDYLIITTNSTYDNNEAAIERFKQHKESRGFSVKIIKRSSWTSEEIRAELIDCVNKWPIEYVLLLGSTNTVPHVITRPLTADDPVYDDYFDEEIEPDVFTDYYYTFLGPSLDPNGNGIYGEWDEMNGLLDLDAEFAVGRIPLSYYLNLDRIIEYEIQTRTLSEEELAWRFNTLLIGAILEFGWVEQELDQWPWYIRTNFWVKDDGAGITEYLDEHAITGNWNSYKLYEAGDEDTPPSLFINNADNNLTPENVLTELAENDYGLVFWFAHGGKRAASRYLVSGYNDYKTPFIVKEDALSTLKDKSTPPVIWSGSCWNGYPLDSLASAFMQYYCLAMIANTNLSWRNTSWDGGMDAYVQTLGLLFAQNIIEEGMAIGDAHTEALSAVSSYINNAHTWQTNLVCILYGDPSVKIYEDRLHPWIVSYKDFGMAHVDTADEYLSHFEIMDLRELYGIDEELLAILRGLDRPFPVLMGDCNEDGLDEVIVFVDPSRSGLALIFDKDMNYLSYIRYDRSFLDKLFDETAPELLKPSNRLDETTPEL